MIKERHLFSLYFTMKIFILSILSFIIIFTSYAQNEYDYWVFKNGIGINFSQNPPEIDSGYYMLPYRWCNNMASIADAEGNLLFYSDGIDIYGKDGNYLSGGKLSEDKLECLGIGRNVMIVKLPNTSKKYIVLFLTEQEFLEDVFPELKNQHKYLPVLHYVIVDMQNAKVLPERYLLSNYVIDLNITRSNSEDTLYLLTTSDSSGIHQYKSKTYPITKEGVGPKISETLLADGRFASPDGNTFVSFPVQPPNTIIVYDFDKTTGKISKRFWLENLFIGDDYSPDERYFNYGVFSSNSEYFYVVLQYMKNKKIAKSEMWSFNVNAPNKEEFEKSMTLVKKFDHPIYSQIAVNPLNEIMYIEIVESHEKYLFGAIPGADQCKVNAKPKIYYEADEFTYQRPIPFLPTFALNKETKIKYTPEKQNVCPGDKLKALDIPVNQYLWWPASFLQDTTIANPVVDAKISNLQDTIQYHLRIIDSIGCYHYDSTRASILPSEQVEIIGPTSICPGSDSISYWVKNSEPITEFKWDINGGKMIYGMGTDSILINWGDTNHNALVNFSSSNEYGCSNYPDQMDVKIFKEIDTALPVGKDLLDCDDLTEIYSVLPKHGSIFDWQINGGDILDGFGTNKISVKWKDDIKFGKIWINESINTDLEVCFGQSDTLKIVNPERFGSENIKLHSVSNILEDTINLSFQYKIDYPQYYRSEFLLQQRKNDQWNNLSTLIPIKTNIDIAINNKNEKIYDFRIAAENLCKERVFSDVHQNIVLNCNENQEKANIDLKWNPYPGWDNLTGYKIFAKSDQGQYHQLSKTISPEYSADILANGFNHQIYVKAENNTGYKSLSNVCHLSYEFPLWAPNIFTPNGDEFNETFYIKNIEKHPENDLYIYDRWGKMKLHIKNYQNNWNGVDLKDGLYYYYLKTKKYNHQIRGWLKILRTKQK